MIWKNIDSIIVSEGMIGHAFYPPIGELHLDAEENWALNGQEGTDLYQVY